MTCKVEMSIRKGCLVAAPVDRVFDFLADVPVAAGLFPSLNKLEPLGNQSWAWTMERIGIDRFYHQTRFACRYHCDPAGRAISWQPIEGFGNASQHGHWLIEAQGDQRTSIELSLKMVMWLPFPALMQRVLRGLAGKEFERLTQSYLIRLQDAMAVSAS